MVDINCDLSSQKIGSLSEGNSRHIRKLNALVSGGHKQVKTRNMKRVNEQAFIADVTSICWEQILHNTHGINSMVREWSSIFSAIIDKHAPIRKIRISDKNSPWVNN